MQPKSEATNTARLKALLAKANVGVTTGAALATTLLVLAGPLKWPRTAGD